MKIHRATVQNFLRVELVEITPTGDVVEITGENGAGKSSVLDGIMFALGGGKAAPKEAVRRGADKARVLLDLGDITVERVRGEGSADKLVVRNKEGAVFPRGQGKLDALVGGLAFDPMAFMDLPPAKQREMLLQILGVDLSAYESRRRAAYDRRTEDSRAYRAEKARLDGLPPIPEGTPDVEVSVAELGEQLRAAMAEQQRNDRKRQEADAARGAVVVAEQVRERAASEAVRFRQLAEQAERAHGEAEREVARLRELAAMEQEAVAALVDPDTYAIQKQMAAAEGVNRAVREAKRRADAEAEVARLAGLVSAGTATIDAVDAEKAAALASAVMPVPGLAVLEEGIGFEGLPLEQASFARRVRVCTAIGAALNPELRIALVRNGNDLDAKSLEAFYEECRVQNLQAWVERIVPSQSDAVEIVAGRVAQKGDA